MRVSVATNVPIVTNVPRTTTKISATAPCTRTSRRVLSLRVPRGRVKAQAFVTHGSLPVHASMAIRANTNMMTFRPRQLHRRAVVAKGHVVVHPMLNRRQVPLRLQPAPHRAPHLLPLDGHSIGCWRVGVSRAFVRPHHPAAGGTQSPAVIRVRMARPV